MYAFHPQALSPSLAALLTALPVWDSTTCQETGEHAPLFTEICLN